MSTPEVTVLGGGFAGIAAALELAERGRKVLLLESRSRLGGRAFSAFHPQAGRVLDNGPHVMLGCYDETRRLLRRLGTEAAFVASPSLSLCMRARGGVVQRLELPALPGPLHLAVGLLRFPGFSAWERMSLSRALLALATRGEPARKGESVAGWEQRYGLGGGPARMIFDPLCRAVMNEEPGAASAALFLSTLREAFRGGAARSAIWIPLQGWSELVATPAERRLRELGVEVRLRSQARELLLRDGRVHGVRLASGADVECGREVIAALPWGVLSRLLPGSGYWRLGRSPLVTAHLTVPASALPDEGSLVGLTDGRWFHWLYRTPGAPASELSLLSGGARELDGLSRDVILGRAEEDLRTHYPGFELADSSRCVVIREGTATFAPFPGVEAFRPSVTGPLGLLLAGDWVETGLPSTLEGAVRSGVAAANEADRRIRAHPQGRGGR